MSRLADIEAALVARLASIPGAGAPLLTTVRGASGAFRSEIRQALSRERLPAAYVSYLDEKPAGGDRGGEGMPRFAILVADRALRLAADPRSGEAEGRGCFELIEGVRQALDDYFPLAGSALAWLSQRFVDADDRQAVFEVLYRLEPVLVAAQFGGEPIGGAESRFAVEIEGPQAAAVETSFPGISGLFRQQVSVQRRRIMARGRLRAVDGTALSEVEAALEERVASGRADEFMDAQGRIYTDCVLERFARIGERAMPTPGSSRAEQACVLTFRPLSEDGSL